MFWRSVVGKLAMTILLLVSFVLFILTILLLEFFEGFHIQETEKNLLQTATKISVIVEQFEDKDLVIKTIERMKDTSSRVVVVFDDGTLWSSHSTNPSLVHIEDGWFIDDREFNDVLINHQEMNKQKELPNKQGKVMIVGSPVSNYNGAVFIYETLDAIDQTRAETTKIIFLAAGIAIVLTTIFAFFLSTRITAPLIKMREAAFDLTRGEFNTKVPILTQDEIGELAMVFNRMGRQLNFHINALRQEKEQLSSIVSSMADGIITLNRNGDMIVTNPPAENFLEDWYFENNVNVTSNKGKLPSALQEILIRVINGEKEVMQEISLQGRNWVMIMTPLYDQTYVRGAVAVIRDMTEERRLDKLRKDFIANVSHELRTPISLLQGYSEAIVDDIAETKEEKNELAQIIQEESLRMGRLVNELLDLSRMEAGRSQLNTELINVEQFSNRILKKFSGVAKENNVLLKLTTHLKVDTSNFDPDQMEQVFTNLIDNAINYIGEQGEVHVSIHNDADSFSVTVADNGKGIPDADLPFIFERFYKIDKARTRSAKKKGTGLGLAIAKNIIESHGGNITVKSKLNIGTTFTFKIPQN